MPEENKSANENAEINREKRILRALLELDEDFFRKREFEVHFVVPYDEEGGEVRGVIENFTAESSADAVRYVSELYGFPEVDDDSIEGTKYGIIKVREVLNDKIFTGEDMLKSWQFIFDNYVRDVRIDGASVRSDDNREEVLMSLIQFFKLPKYNKLTDKYGIPDFIRRIRKRRSRR